MEIVLLALTVITSLLILPFTPNMSATPKELFFVIGILAMGALWLAPLLAKRPLRIPASNKLLLPLGIFMAAIVVNLLVVSEARTEALTGTGSLFLGGGLLTLLLLTRDTGKLVRRMLITVVGIGSLLAVFGLLQLTLLSHLTILPLAMQTKAFTPTGAPLVTVVYLVIGAVLAATMVATEKTRLRTLAAAALVIQVIAIVAYLSLMLPGGELDPHLLSIAAGWSVALDALKSPGSLFFGVGLANFPAFFTHVKPLFVNTTPLWNVTPSSAGQEILDLLATTGLVGVLPFLYLLMVLGKRLLALRKNPEAGGLAALSLLATIAFVTTPISTPVTLLFFVSLGLIFKGEVKEVKIPPKYTLPLAAAGMIILLGVAYGAARVYAAEYHVYRASQALAKNDGKAVYEQSLAAVTLVPKMTSYHLSFSQVNLSLAAALSQKSSLTDSDRQQIATLVSQAIAEGKTAAGLRPSLAASWQNLGSLYRNLINVASGADQFATQSYAQAVTLDPANPVLRVEYGGLLYQLGSAATDKTQKNTLLSQAVQQFQTAVQLKPDYGNGYYNLSKALEAEGDIQSAYAAMQQVVANVAPNSTDYQTATSALSELKAKLPTSTAAPTITPTPVRTNTLSAPSPLPSPLKGGPIILPEASNTPAPTPTATPTVTPAPSAK